MNPKEKKVIAFHEAGHAITGHFLEHADPVQKITIVPRGIGALGYTLQAPLEVTSGVAPVEQSAQALGAIRAAVEAHDAFELAALGLAATASGSVIIALALSHGEIEAEAAFNAAFIDEMWQIEQWGNDEDADTRQQNARSDITVAARFLSLHRTGRLV